MLVRFVTFFPVFIVFVFLSLAHPVYAMKTDRATVASVAAQVHFINEELQLLAREMGKSTTTAVAYLIKNPTPSQIYVLANELNNKVKQLAFEVNHKFIVLPEPPYPIQYDHIWHLLEATAQALGEVKTSLGISTQSQEKSIESAMPAELFVALSLANRNANLLLEKPTNTAAVYQSVLRSVNATARLLEQFKGVKHIPQIPELKRQKTQADVFAALMQTFNRYNKIAYHSQLPVVALQQFGREEVAVNNSDLHEVAALLGSELLTMHHKLSQANPPVPSFYPGHKTAAEVWQQLELLQAQLSTLQQQVSQAPHWLDA